jgi:hypothetical protein
MKHVSAAMNQNATTEELSEAVSSVLSAPRLYSEDQREKSESSFQLAIMASRGWPREISIVSSRQLAMTSSDDRMTNRKRHVRSSYSDL